MLVSSTSQDVTVLVNPSSDDVTVMVAVVNQDVTIEVATLGVKGNTGSQGEQGVQGEQGIQGIQGVKGDVGEQGIQGIQGIQGVAGVNGLSGTSEIDFGETPINEKEFTIVDANIVATSKITASLAYEAPTGKDLDEIEMDILSIICGQSAMGSFKMFVKSIDGSYLADKFKINYLISV